MSKRAVPGDRHVGQQAITSISFRGDFDGLRSIQKNVNVFVRLVGKLHGQAKAVELVVLVLPFAYQRCQA